MTAYIETLIAYNRPTEGLKQTGEDNMKLAITKLSKYNNL